MSELRDIQRVATDSKAPIGDLLRACLLLSGRLKNTELRTWAMQELNGYADIRDVPDYRVIGAPALGHFVGPFQREVRNQPIPARLLPENGRDYAERVFIKEPIAALERTVQTPSDSCTVPWPADLVLIMADKLMPGYHLVAVNQVFKTADLAGIVDNVRTRVLDFSLRIEELGGDEADDSLKSLPPAAVTQIIHQTILGGTFNNLSVGGSQVTQSQTTVVAGDLSSLRTYLLDLGADPADVADLEKAAAEEEPSLRKAGMMGWLGRMKGKSWALAKNKGGDLILDLVIKGVMLYWGMS
jgi:hypothetical protein